MIRDAKAYTHIDKDGVLWRFDGARPISIIADQINEEARVYFAGCAGTQPNFSVVLQPVGRGLVLVGDHGVCRLDVSAMKDGLYRVVTPHLCAGFVVKNGKVVACAPILRKRLAYWRTVAVLV